MLVVAVAVAALGFSLGIGVVGAQPVDEPRGTVVVESDEMVDSIDTIAGSIVIQGTVTGDVSGVAGHVHVADGGQVDGSVEAAAGAVRIDGFVAGDVATGSGHFELTETGSVGGDVDIGAGYLTVDGQVDGDVRAGADRIALGPNTVVGGEFRYDAVTFEQDPAATVGGSLTQDSRIERGLMDMIPDITVPGWVGVVYGLLANLLLGVILLAAFPGFSRRLSSRVADQPGVSGGVGLLVLVGVPVVLILIAVTIIGIPLALLGSLGFVAVLWVAAVYGQFAVGAWTLGRTGRENKWLALGIGLVGFAILGAIPVVGGLFELIALLVGLGALALGLRDAYRRREAQRAGPQQTTLDEVSSA